MQLHPVFEGSQPIVPLGSSDCARITATGHVLSVQHDINTFLVLVQQPIANTSCDSPFMICALMECDPLWHRLPHQGNMNTLTGDIVYVKHKVTLIHVDDITILGGPPLLGSSAHLFPTLTVPRPPFYGSVYLSSYTVLGQVHTAQDHPELIYFDAIAHTSVIGQAPIICSLWYLKKDAQDEVGSGPCCIFAKVFFMFQNLHCET